MNLNEERNYQKLMDALDALGLSEENRKTADLYFAQSEGKEAEILKQAKLQDLSELPEEDQNKSISYIEHLKKRGKKEELSRYVRFVAAAGGSTARYALFHHVYMLKDLQEYLPSDQSLAIRAEALVWNMWTLSWMNIKELVRPVPDNLKLLRQAMSLCCHKYDNAKVLLSALYLNEKKKKEENQRAIQQILGRHFSSEGSEEREIIGFFEKKSGFQSAGGIPVSRSERGRKKGAAGLCRDRKSAGFLSAGSCKGSDREADASISSYTSVRMRVPGAAVLQKFSGVSADYGGGKSGGYDERLQTDVGGCLVPGTCIQTGVDSSGKYRIFCSMVYEEPG